MILKDREEAGRLLADEIIKKYDHNLQNPLVVAIPRGGVVVAKPIADSLNAPLTVILVKKIGAPFNEEYAIGAITEDGEILIGPNISEDVALKLGITDDYIYSKSKEILEILKERKKLYKNSIKDFDVKDRDVILVDDGIATGLTTETAILSIRNLFPRRIILAVPVMPYEKVNQFKELVDDLIVLDAPVNFSAVGQFYLDFSQVSDEDVINILNEYAT
jgi:predicted phosphoribosyltransferase